MAKKSKVTAVSYDLMGNPIDVPQNYNDYFIQPQQQYQPVQPYNPMQLNVGNQQWVQQGLNTGSNQQYQQPMTAPPYQAPPMDMSYSQNPNGSFAINTDYINTNLNGGTRGMDAYGNYDQNTNRNYAYEGNYGNRWGREPNFFANGGSIDIKPSHAGKFTKWAKSKGMTVSEATSKVLANPDKYSDEVKKMANFARNIGKAQNGTTLNPQQESGYQQWRAGLPKNLQSEYDYDLRGLYNSNPQAKPSSDLHFPDTYKLPNHPTFSNESQYYNGVQPGVGGYWQEDTYVPNPMIGPPVPPTAEYGMQFPNQFNNPFTDDRQFNYGSSMDYAQYVNQGPNQALQQQPLQQMQSAPYQQLPVDNTPQQAQPLTSMPGQANNTDTGTNYGSVANGIQSGAQAIGGLFSGINDLRNQIILGGGALINGLLPDQHNIRKKAPVLTDQTLSYQPQYNNMLENGGNMQSPGVVVNNAYNPGDTVDLSPEEVAQLKKAGYTFDIL